MSIQTNCAECGKRYKVPDDYAGKKVKCTDCGATFSIPKASVVVMANKPVAVAKSAPPVAARPGGVPSARPGVKPAARPVPPPRAASPRYDDNESVLGAALSAQSAAPEPNDIELAEEVAAPRAVSSAPPTRRFVPKPKKQAASVGFNFPWWALMLLPVLAFGLCLGVAAGMETQTAKLFSVAFVVIGAVLLIVGGIWQLIAVFKNSVLLGLLTFVPFVGGLVSLYALFAFWEDTKYGFGLGLLGVATIFGALGGVAVVSG